MNPLRRAIERGHALFFYRGRVALYIILKALGVAPGDEVLVQAFTCLAVSNPIVNTGAKPIYVDIHPDTLNMDPNKLADNITPKSKAIVVQHTFGIPADMGPILDIARKHSLYVIEDCAHTVDSRYAGQPVGTFGDAAFYSFEWGKPIVIGLGGAAIVNNLSLIPAMRNLHEGMVSPPVQESWLVEMQYVVHALLLSPALYWTIRDAYHLLSNLGLIVGSFRDEELEGQRSPDYRRRMFGIHYRRLMKRLERLEAVAEHRKWVVGQYRKYLPDTFLGPTTEAVLLRYPLWVDEKRTVLEEARNWRVELSDIFRTPIHPLAEEHWHLLGYEKGVCPVAEEAARRVVSLPTHNKIEQTTIDRAIAFLHGRVRESPGEKT